MFFESSDKIFNGKTALIIGGSGGIGAELSNLLSETGADLIIHGKSAKKLSAISNKIKNKSGKTPKTVSYDFRALILQSTFQGLSDCELFHSAQSADILCVCYGPFLQKDLRKMTSADWLETTLLNYALPGTFLSASLDNMIQKKWGRILLFGGTGTASRTEFKTNAPYAGAKSALNVLVRSVAAYYAKYGITCNAVLPGFTKTEYISAETESLCAEKMPLSTMILPQSVAKAALFLLSNPDLNGVLLQIDRGWTPDSKTALFS